MPLAKAILNGTVLAESPTWESVEGNVYVYPPLTYSKHRIADNLTIHSNLLTI